MAAPSSLCPRRWAHSLMCLWIHMGWACPTPQPAVLLAGSACPNSASAHGCFCFRAWESCSGVLDFRCCPPGASWAALQEVPQKNLGRSGFGEMPGLFLPLLSISCCLGSRHTLDNQVGSHSPRSGELTGFQHYAKALSAEKPDHAHHVKIKGELKTSRPWQV